MAIHVCDIHRENYYDNTGNDNKDICCDDIITIFNKMNFNHDYFENDYDNKYNKSKMTLIVVAILIYTS